MHTLEEVRDALGSNFACEGVLEGLVLQLGGMRQEQLDLGAKENAGIQVVAVVQGTSGVACEHCTEPVPVGLGKNSLAYVVAQAQVHMPGSGVL
jgi:hypothetical protein